MPSVTWCMTDADQQSTPNGASYYNYIPVKPVHGHPKKVKWGTTGPVGPTRNYLFFDWHVETKRTMLDNGYPNNSSDFY